MKKIRILFVLVFMILFSQYSVFATESEIIVTSSQATQSDIIVEENQIYISITAKGLSDVYAFTLDLNYDSSEIEIISIKAGDIFSDYGSAILINKINNQTGTASFMQTLLSVDKGVSEDKILCVVQISAKPGVYNFEEDFGVDIQIANSAPEYIEIYLSDTNIIVSGPIETSSPTTSEKTAAITPTATPSPQLGVITPVPDSDQSSNFVVAEEEPIEDIIAEVENDENKAEQAKIVMEESKETEAENKYIPTAQLTAQPANTEESQDKKIDPKLLLLIIVLAVCVPAIIISLIIHFKGRKNIHNNIREHNHIRNNNYTRRR